MNKVIVKIDGMMCGMCESHVNDAIRKAFKVKKVKSSHQKGEAEILMETEPDEAVLRDAINATGYEVISIVSEPYKKKSLFGLF